MEPRRKHDAACVRVDGRGVKETLQEHVNDDCSFFEVFFWIACAPTFVLWTLGDADGHIHSCSGEFEQPCWHIVINLRLRIRSLVTAKLGSWILRQTLTTKLAYFARGSARLKLVRKSNKTMIRTCAPEPEHGPHPQPTQETLQVQNAHSLKVQWEVSLATCMCGKKRFAERIPCKRPRLTWRPQLP